VIALAAALVTLGAWVIVDRGEGQTKGIASGEIVSLLNARFAAFNSAGTKPMSGFYSRDAILEEFDVVPPYSTRGADEIGARLEGISRLWDMAGFRITEESPVIQIGPFVAQAARISGGTPQILVYKIDENGKIAHQWAIADFGR
jgi:hypothetical protein